MQGSTARINAYASEHSCGTVRCELAEGKGRTLKATRPFEEGEVILVDRPLRIIREEPSHEDFKRLCKLCEDEPYDHGPLWYWCALRSLTVSELDSKHSWAAWEATGQEHLLMFHQGEVSSPSDGVAAIAAQFVPELADVLQLERCLQAWIHNAFAVASDKEHAEPGFATFFLPSFMSHSCLPSAIWHFGPDFSFVLRARRRISAGEEVTISYLDEAELLEFAPVRRHRLQRSKEFWCACARCVQPEDLSRGMLCGSCHQGSVYARLTHRAHGACVLRPLRPVNYDEASASNLELWLTIGAPSLRQRNGRHYYELELGSGVCEPQVGWASELFREADDWTGTGVGDDEHSWAADGERHLLWAGGKCRSVAWPCTWHEGDVVGCAVDVDAGAMQFAVNGQWLPTSNLSFNSGGGAVYPAISMQGDFEFRLTAASFKFCPPDDSFKPLLQTQVQLNREAPLQGSFHGAACHSCGSQADALESQRLCQLEHSLQDMVSGLQLPIPAAEAARVHGFIDASFAKHALAQRARQLIISSSEKELQLRLLQECRDFTSAYPGLNAAHAWALSDHAQALVEVAHDEAAGKLHHAVAEFVEAARILRTMFGSEHEWVTEIEERASVASTRLAEVLS